MRRYTNPKHTYSYDLYEQSLHFHSFFFVLLASLLSSNLNSIITLHYTCITLLFAQCDVMRCDAGCLAVLVCPLSFAHSESERASRQTSKLVVVIVVVVVCFQVFFSLWILCSLSLSLHLVRCGSSSQHIHHIQSLWYSYINLYVIFIYSTLQSFVGEPLCVSILLLSHFVHRLYRYVVRCCCCCCFCCDRRSRYPSPIFHPSNVHRECDGIRSTVGQFCRSKSADVWCCQSHNHFSLHSVNKRRPDAETKNSQSLYYMYCIQYMYIYIGISASALSIELATSAASDSRRSFLFFLDETI